MIYSIRFSTLAAAAWIALAPAIARGQSDAQDWPMYNRDVLGTRHSRGETAIGRGNAGRLEEKWRFPTKESGDLIGVIHATPVVVGGCVYFGTTASSISRPAASGKLVALDSTK